MSYVVPRTISSRPYFEVPPVVEENTSIFRPRLSRELGYYRNPPKIMTEIPTPGEQSIQIVEPLPETLLYRRKYNPYLNPNLYIYPEPVVPETVQYIYPPYDPAVVANSGVRNRQFGNANIFSNGYRGSTYNSPNTVSGTRNVAVGTVTGVGNFR